MRADVGEALGEALRESGAVAALVVDAAALATVERGYGPRAYASAQRELQAVVFEALRGVLLPCDRLVREEGERDLLAVLFFRARDDRTFYTEQVPRMAEWLRRALAESGNRVTYPYRREMPELPVGHALQIDNPTLRPATLVRRTVAAAADDAALEKAIARRARERSFVDIIIGEQVTALYEPIVNAMTREVVGFEALIRGPWESDLHSPGALFCVAERMDLVYELDGLCRRSALAGARGLAPGKLLFLNCLPTAMYDPQLTGEALLAQLGELRLRPEDIVLEISERESIQNFSIFREARDCYGELGFKIALDDTGVAYGSLESIMELKPDFIKADLSLVRSIDSDPPRQELLRALHGVALKMDAQIVAEGIETSDELATIQSIGIPLGQGYLFGRPAPMRRSV